MLTAADIEAYYRAVAARMAELPVYNPALEVELLGWRECAEIGGVGVLITPWCMNLFWQPPADAELPGKGERVLLALPSGDYECTLNHDPSLGRHASASLCSPMQDFASQDAARAMAEEVLQLVFAIPEPETTKPEPGPAAISRRDLFRRALGGSK